MAQLEFELGLGWQNECGSCWIPGTRRRENRFNLLRGNARPIVRRRRFIHRSRDRKSRTRQ